jgi:iron complex outermembrane recepter protein
LTYTINKNHALNLTFSRRIDRPSYQDLNPFENKIDELSYQKGNAFLRPQYTNSVEVTHTFLSRYNTTIGYSHIKDYRAQIIDTTEKNRSFITPRNLAEQKIYNINISAPFQIRKWWNLFATFNGYRSEYKADFGKGKVINVNVNAYSLFGQQTFSFKDGLTLEMSGYYNSPNIWGGTFRNRAMGGMDIGLQKTLFKGKGNVKFSYTDVLETMRWQGVSDFGGAYIRVGGGWESNTFRMNLTYRFGNNQVKAARQRKVSSEEENKRLNNSGGLGGS